MPTRNNNWDATPKKNASWKDIAEAIGFAAIVASLIFVGLELRQSQRIAVAAQYQVRTGFNLDFFQNMNEPSYQFLGERTKQRLNDWEIDEEY